MGLVSLTLISSRKDTVQAAFERSGRLIASAQACQGELCLTGVLIVAGDLAALCLEGEDNIVNKWARRMKSDLDTALLIDRRFVKRLVLHRWSVGYSGESVFVAKIIEDCLQTFGNRDLEIEQLRCLMSEFQNKLIGVCELN